MQRIALALIIVVFSAPPSSALVSTNVPLGHWSYDAVDKLANYGLIDSAMLTIKPLSRVEMARHVGQAMLALERMDDVPEILHSIVDRLKDEYRGELILIGTGRRLAWRILHQTAGGSLRPLSVRGPHAGHRERPGRRVPAGFELPRRFRHARHGAGSVRLLPAPGVCRFHRGRRGRRAGRRLRQGHARRPSRSRRERIPSGGDRAVTARCS